MRDHIEVEPSDEVDWSKGPLELPIVGFAVKSIGVEGESVGEIDSKQWPADLPVAGFTMNSLDIPEVVAVASGESAASLVRICLPPRFLFGGPDGSVVDLDGRSDGALAAVLTLRGERISRATATAGSHLRVEFEGGRYVEVLPAAAVEAWEVRGPGFLILSPAGGPEPVLWSWKRSA